MLLLAAALGCSDLTVSANDVDVRITSDRQVVSAAQPANLTVTIHNRGHRAFQTWPAQAYGCQPAYIVLTLSDSLIAPPPRACLAIAYSPVSLGAGDSLVVHDSWSGLTADTSGNEVQLPARDYRLTGRVFTELGTIPSEAITVSVGTTP